MATVDDRMCGLVVIVCMTILCELVDRERKDEMQFCLFCHPCRRDTSIRNGRACVLQQTTPPKRCLRNELNDELEVEEFSDQLEVFVGWVFERQVAVSRGDEHRSSVAEGLE